eukprot:3116332-Pyramimonas_sp.AAC.1
MAASRDAAIVSEALRRHQYASGAERSCHQLWWCHQYAKRCGATSCGGVGELAPTRAHWLSFPLSPGSGARFTE